MPNLSQFRDLRKNKEVFKEFCTHVLSHVCMRSEFKARAPYTPVSEVASATQEGFALFLLEANYDKWSWEIANPDAASRRDRPSNEYTDNKTGKAGQGYAV